MPSISTTAGDEETSAAARITASAASRSAAVNGSASLLLEGPDDTAERPTGHPHERDGDREEGDDVRLDAQVVAASHIRPLRDRVAAAPAAAVAGLVGPSAEARPRHRDRDETDVVHILL